MAVLTITTVAGTAPHGHGAVRERVPSTEASGHPRHPQIVWPPNGDWSVPRRLSTVVYVTVVFVILMLVILMFVILVLAQGSGRRTPELGW